MDQAIQYWAHAGAGATQLNALSQVDVQLADLSGSYLGMSSASSNLIWIDVDAAGHGWGGGGMDLFSTVTHELGHKLGFDHGNGSELMAATLAPQAWRLGLSSFMSEYSSHDELESPISPAWTHPVDDAFSLWGTSHFSRTALPETSNSASNDRIFEMMAMDANWDQLFGGGWNVDQGETDTLMEGDRFGQSRILLKAFLSDSENSDEEQIDEDLLDELVLGLI